MRGNCSVHLSANNNKNESPTKSVQPLRSHTQSFGTLAQIFKVPPFWGHCICSAAICLDKSKCNQVNILTCKYHDLTRHNTNTRLSCPANGRRGTEQLVAREKDGSSTTRVLPRYSRSEKRSLLLLENKVF